MKNKALIKKVSMFLLVCIMSVSIFALVACDNDSDRVVIFIASDFQQEDGTGSNINEILSAITKDKKNKEVDGILFAGDYTTNLTPKNEKYVNEGIKQLISIFEEYGWEVPEDRLVLCQGNHDDGGNYDVTGPQDSDSYGVYLINEDDFPWKVEPVDEYDPRAPKPELKKKYDAIVDKTVSKLDKYLQDKVMSEYDKPIFVMSHLPLHNTFRQDNRGAERICDTLNKYGSDLTIVYIFGHNHSYIFDEEIGYNTYLTEGDEMIVADDTGNGVAKSLKFTYLNAGYVGYHYADTELGKAELSATMIEIAGDKLIFNRYSKDGLTQLKNAGTTDDADNEKVYESPQIVIINKR